MAFENCDVAAACASVTSLLPHSFQSDLDLLRTRYISLARLEDLPDLEAADIVACLEYAAQGADHPVLLAQ